LLDERDLEDVPEDDLITLVKRHMAKMYHFVHLAEHFVIIQWSGRHVKRRAKNKMADGET
jgi:hypothetical protein